MSIATGVEVRPLSGSLGAEVRGVDVARDLSDDVIRAIRAAWLEHLVLFFPDQDLTPERQQAFAARFGEVTPAHPVEPALVGHPQVLPVDSANGHTDFWHTDVTFMAYPPMASMLYAVELPPAGGDTMFANMRLAYETLAEPLRRLCDELVALHYATDYADPGTFDALPDTAAPIAAGPGWDPSRLPPTLPHVNDLTGAVHMINDHAGG